MKINKELTSLIDTKNSAAELAETLKQALAAVSQVSLDLDISNRGLQSDNFKLSASSARDSKSTIDNIVFLFKAEMGAGKTTFIKYFAEALDVKGNISSPTFTGMNQYDFKLNEQDFNLYHLDLYQKPFMLDDAYELGDSASLWLIEWAENLDLEILKLWELNPAAKIYQIELSILDETRRQLQVNSYDDNSKESAKANLELNSPVH